MTRGCWKMLFAVFAVVLIALGFALFLFIKDSQTGHSRHPDLDWTFDISPNGHTIVFCGPGNGGMDIYLYEIPTSTITPLLQSDKYELAPKFSSDGKMIVFAGGEPGNRGDHIYVYHLDTKGLDKLTDGISNDASPSFCDHDQKIVFTNETEYRWGGLMSSWDGGGEVYTMDLRGKNRTLVYNKKFPAFEPQISKNGEVLLLQASSRPQSGYGIDVVDPRTSQTRLRIPEGRGARLSPDAKSLIFTSGNYNDHFEIHEAPINGGPVKGMVKWEGESCYSPRISPDGKYIYYFQGDHGSLVRTLYRLSRDGKNREEVFNFDQLPLPNIKP